MAMIVANNLNAISTQRSLNLNNRSMSQSLERISTGYKINNGKDDPSGLVISEQLRAQNVGLKRAVQNTQEANNVLGIAEGALNEMNSILKKMRQLAIHSANNGVTSSEQVAADQAEIDSSIQTLDRIARTTKFSDQFLLNGNKELQYDSSINVNDSYDMKLVNDTSSDIRQIFKREDFRLNINFSGGSIENGTNNKQAEKAYFEVTKEGSAATEYNDKTSTLTADQSFTIAGSKGSRLLGFSKGAHLGEMVSSINNVKSSTGIEASLIYDMDVTSNLGSLSSSSGSAHLSGGMEFFVRDEQGNPVEGGMVFASIGTSGSHPAVTDSAMPAGGGSGIIQIGGIDFAADANGYYGIETAAHLNALSSSAGAGGVWSNSYALKADIDMSAYPSFSPIGRSFGAGPFLGNFEGNGHTVSNLTINTTSAGTGLFGYVFGGVVANTNIDGANITSTATACGAITGFLDNMAEVRNCHATSVNIDGAFGSGGLVGYSYNTSVITDCSANASVNSNNNNSAGCLVGFADDTTISNSSSKGVVIGSSAVGGLAGRAMGGTIINNCFSTASVTSTNSGAGGLVGELLNSEATNTYAVGDVMGVVQAGGIAGTSNASTISNSKAFNNSITVTGSDGGRVYGLDVGGSTLSENYANKSMTVTIAGVEKTLVKGADQIDGEDTGVQNSGYNADGYGRIYMKMLDDDEFAIYKDDAMSMQIGSGLFNASDTATISSINNSECPAITFTRAPGEMEAGYSSIIQLENIQEDLVDQQGVDFSDLTNSFNSLSSSGNRVFHNTGSFLSGLDLGENTSETGDIYVKVTSTNTGNSTVVMLYNDERMREEDLVAQSGSVNLSANQYEGVRIFGVRSDSGEDSRLYGTINLGYIDRDGTASSKITTTNHAIRLNAEEYGSDQFVRIEAHEGALFSRYSGTDGAQLLDSGLTGTKWIEYGQNGTVSLNGQEVILDGIKGTIVNLDTSADIVFKEGYIGCSTIAATGYGVGTIATRAGQFNDYSDDVVHALHSTTESLGDWTGGMQFQLGEGAGDQERTVISLKSLTATDMGRVIFNDEYGEDNFRTAKTLSINDVLSGGMASLSQEPIKALEIIDQAIDDVTKLRAQIGAFQANMLETNANNLTVAIENITKTESYIRDSDMALESTNFSKNQILVQAGTSMLAQANGLSEGVLSLIQ